MFQVILAAWRNGSEPLRSRGQDNSFRLLQLLFLIVEAHTDLMDFVRMCVIGAIPGL